MSENPRKFRRRRRFVQQFGAGMAVTHETHGLGYVISASRYKIKVDFPKCDEPVIVESRELQFTDEERVRRERIYLLMRAGGFVTAAYAPGTKVIHRLLGEGEIKSHDGSEATLTVDFENDYTNPKGEVVSVSDLRVIR